MGRFFPLTAPTQFFPRPHGACLQRTYKNYRFVQTVTVRSSWLPLGEGRVHIHPKRFIISLL